MRTTSPLYLFSGTTPISLGNMTWLGEFSSLRACVKSHGLSVLNIHKGLPNLALRRSPSFFMLLSFWLLGIALRTLPLGIAYGVWVGIGAIGTAIVSIYLFNEPATLIKALSLLMIVAGIAGLKISA